jgi:hypothetical protein
MPKTIYTEQDIEALVKQGSRTLRLGGDAVLTELAYEKAHRLGLQLEQAGADTPPSAPVRPYLSQPDRLQPARPNPPATSMSAAPSAPQVDLAARIRTAVTARLGDRIDARLLDTIIARVLKATGLK